MSTTGQAVACACGRRFQASAQLAGRRVKCPACGQPIDVPALAGSPLDSAALAMQSLPAVSPLHGPARAASPAAGRPAMPAGVWIGLGAGGCALVLILVVVLGLRMVGQRLMAENMARAAERQAAREAAAPGAGQPVAPTSALGIYQSPTGRFSVEFPGRPKRELVRSSEPGRLSQSHWEASFAIGDFSHFRGEQFLVIEKSHQKKLTPAEIEAGLTELVNVTANVDVGRGRLLGSVDLSQPGYRGREVTYEYTAKSGGRVSGRNRVLITDRELISIEWVAAPAKSETAEVTRFFDSFKLQAQ